MTSAGMKQIKFRKLKEIFKKKFQMRHKRSEKRRQDMFLRLLCCRHMYSQQINVPGGQSYKDI